MFLSDKDGMLTHFTMCILEETEISIIFGAAQKCYFILGGGGIFSKALEVIGKKSQQKKSIEINLENF